MKRHALPALFLFFGASLFLLARPPWGRLLVAYLLAVSVWRENRDLWRYVLSIRAEEPRSEYHAPLRAWIAAARQADPDLRVATSLGQRLPPFFDDVAFHWVHTTTTVADYQVLFQELQVDYLILPDDLYSFADARDPTFAPLFRSLESAPPGFDVYVLREVAP